MRNSLLRHCSLFRLQKCQFSFFCTSSSLWNFVWLAKLFMRERKLGSISPTFFSKFLQPQIPKSVKSYWLLDWNFTLWGSALVKAARRRLMKLTPWVDFTNMFTSSFYECRYQKGKGQSSHQCLFALLGSMLEKSVLKRLVKLTPAFFTFIATLVPKLASM